MKAFGFIPVTAILAVAALLFSCAPPKKPVLSENMVDDIAALRTKVRATAVTVPEIAQADSLYAIAVRFRAAGKQQMAYNYFDYSMLLYRLALVKQELIATAQKTRELEAALEETNSRLTIYEKALHELKATKKP